MSPGSNGGDDRIHSAEVLLQEAVFRSRAGQSLSAALGPAPEIGSKGRCGLGERAVVVLDLSAEGVAAFDRVWPIEPPATEVERIRGVLADWVKDQDAIDRRRNHFIKAFRAKHGFDRRAYTSDQIADYDMGLARINAEESAERRAAALELLIED